MLTTENQRSKKDQIQREREGREKIEKRETEEREKRERRETKEREILKTREPSPSIPLGFGPIVFLSISSSR